MFLLLRVIEKLAAFLGEIFPTWKKKSKYKNTINFLKVFLK